MRNKVLEAFFSFLVLCLFACVMAAVIALGMLLMPFFIILLMAVATKEVIRWKRKTKPLQQNRMVIQQQKTTVIRPIAPRKHFEKAA